MDATELRDEVGGAVRSGVARAVSGAPAMQGGRGGELTAMVRRELALGSRALRQDPPGADSLRSSPALRDHDDAAAAERRVHEVIEALQRLAGGRRWS
jgi:hypothetical protein